MMRSILPILIGLLTGIAFAQPADPLLRPATTQTAALARMAARVRVTQVEPHRDSVMLNWRRGGEGLGGEVERGTFTAPGGKTTLQVGHWSDWMPLETLCGRERAWTFPTVTIAEVGGNGRLAAVENSTLDFEFAESKRTFTRFTEPSPRGVTATFAFPGAMVTDDGATNPRFVDALQGLSSYVRSRRENIETLFPDIPRITGFAIFGRLGGYGEKGGRGIRHTNPEIVADECAVLRRLGVNSLKDNALIHAEVAGAGESFDRMAWPRLGGGKQLPPGVCPFEPEPRRGRGGEVDAMLQELRDSKEVREMWVQRGDEIGVAAKEHLAECERCAKEFRDYLKQQNVTPQALGQSSWDGVKPYPLWPPAPAAAMQMQRGNRRSRPMPATTQKSRNRGEQPILQAPDSPQEALRFYYTFRFMTYATAPTYRQAVAAVAPAPLFAMQAPTPSWSGHSLDWHEFYDLGANTAFVWETSNTDPQVWQLESYLADIGRCIAERHQMPMGCLVKPHRGAVMQRTLAGVTRGVRAIEWYTYGPDYAKGDSFSQSPQLLEQVARMAQFLAQAEPMLHEAKLVDRPRVALVSPRSSEIWGRTSPLLVTAFENAKWVYLALKHAHVPVDVLSEQQLAEGKLQQYGAIYIIGPNLRNDAAAEVAKWVEAGGTLWTDAIAISRDEANQPSTIGAKLTGMNERALQTWAKVEPYRAIDLKPFDDSQRPADVAFGWGSVDALPAVGREPLTCEGEVLSYFADGRPAVVQRSIGQGKTIVVGLWAGLTYSAKARRSDFDMRSDFDGSLRSLITTAAIDCGGVGSVTTSDPLVEAVLLEKDGRRCIALMNWNYRAARELQPAENLRITLPKETTSVTSLRHGRLRVTENSLTLPRLDEIDLLALE